MPVALIPNDPLLGQAWHLRNTGQAGGTAGVDLNVAGAWGFWSGRGVLVAVADDGVEASHPDLADSMWTRPATVAAPTDPNLLSGLPVANGLDNAGNNHGTSVAGIIAAGGDNGLGALGIAPDARLVSYRTLGEGAASTQAVFAQALADGAAVVNGSYGLNSAFGADGEGLAAMAAFVSGGRGGLGGLFVKSNGNERAEAGAPSPADGGAEAANATRFTIAVAAVDNTGTVASYSNPGGNLFISGFGGESDGRLATGQGVLATDRAGPLNGYNDGASPGGDYTGFNGTSAAAPTVAGVLALVLEANPGLGHRDVQEILALSARRTDPLAGTAGHDSMSRTPWLANAATNKDGGGWAFSHDYGFGLADAGAATRLAESWAWAPRTEANLIATAADHTVAGSITAGAAWSTQLAIAQPEGATAGFRVNRVELVLDLSAARPSDLTVTLLSPGGTAIRLLTTTGNAFAEVDGSLDFSIAMPLTAGQAIGLGSPGFWGEAGAGSWTLSIATAGTAATVNAAYFSVFGDSAWVDAARTIAATDLRSVAFLTDGFAAAVAAAPAAATLARHGETALNLAATSAGAVLSLADPGASTNRVGATAVTIQDGAAVHHLLGGGGNDSFTGTIGADTLGGGRGDDLLVGLGGADTLLGNAGNDILIGNAGADILRGGAGRDAAVFGTTKAAATVQRQADGTLRVLSAAEGEDSLSSVELLVFTDGAVNVGPLDARDFAGSGQAGLLQRDTSGALRLVEMAGNAAQASTLMPVVDPTARLEATGDMNGDGFADMSFRRDDGGWIFSWGQGKAAPVTTDLGVLDASWAIHGMPDLDGDGVGDLVLLHSTGFLAAFPSVAGGAAFLTLAPGTIPGDPGGAPIGVAAGWSLQGFADLDGDAKADLLLRAPDGELLLMRMDGTRAIEATILPFPLLDATLAGMGDLDGDRRADIVVRNGITGEVTVHLMDGAAVRASETVAGPAGYDAFAVADYSGDGKADIMWRQPSGELLLWEMDGAVRLFAGTVAAPEAGWTLIA